MHRNLLGALCGAAALFGIVNPATAVNLVVNGSFESPDIGGGAFVLYQTANNPVLAPWVISGDVMHLDNWNGNVADEGAQWLSLESFGGAVFPNNFGTVSQTIATLPGYTYKLNFAYSALSRGINEIQSFTYDYGTGPNILNVDVTGVATNLMAPWTTNSVDFVATGATTTISFTGGAIATGFYGGAIDDVRMIVFAQPAVPTPEPGSAMLLGLAATGLVWQARRRRK